MKKALIAAILCLASGPARAANSSAEAIDERAQILSSGYHNLSVAFADIFQKSAGFASGAAGFSPPAAKKKWGFNVGLEGGATLTPIDKGLATRSLDPDQQYVANTIKQLPDALPIPQAGFNAHLGLPPFFIFDSFDAGLRYAGLNFAAGTANIDLADVGLDLRGNVFETGQDSPVTVTLGFSADSYKGSIKFKSAQAVDDSTTVSGYRSTGNMTNGIDVDLENAAYGIRASVSRKLRFFTPYLGVEGQINSGSAGMRGYTSGDLTMRDLATGNDVATSSAPVEGKASAPIGAMDLRFGGGFELDFVFAYLQLNGEYGAISGGYGGNIQLGGKFR